MNRPLKPDSDNARVLDLLTVFALSGDGWVDHIYRRFHHDVMVHSRIAELRGRGWLIDCRRFTDENGEPDYRYKLMGFKGCPVEAAKA
jgi:hypothetical protein